MMDCSGFAPQGTYPNERRCTLCVSVDAVAVVGDVAGSGMELAGAAAVDPSAAVKITKTFAKPLLIYSVQTERLLLRVLRLHAASTPTDRSTRLSEYGSDSIIWLFTQISI